MATATRKSKKPVRTRTTGSAGAPPAPLRSKLPAADTRSGNAPKVAAAAAGPNDTGAKRNDDARRAKKKDKPDKDKGKRREVERETGRAKLVRDSFTMPDADYRLIASLKAQALSMGIPVKKSELLRAGLVVLSRLPSTQLADLISEMPKIKTGRPGKKKK